MTRVAPEHVNSGIVYRGNEAMVLRVQLPSMLKNNRYNSTSRATTSPSYINMQLDGSNANLGASRGTASVTRRPAAIPTPNPTKMSMTPILPDTTGLINLSQL